MIGIDTNVLVRYVIQDDLEQSRKATRFLERECTDEEPGLINSTVLTELVWVLESVYRYAPYQISVAVNAMLRASQLRFENLDDTRYALSRYDNGADFADALIAATNVRLGCDYSVTFDRAAAKHLGFHLL